MRNCEVRLCACGTKPKKGNFLNCQVHELFVLLLSLTVVIFVKKKCRPTRNEKIVCNKSSFALL